VAMPFEVCYPDNRRRGKEGHCRKVKACILAGPSLPFLRGSVRDDGVSLQGARARRFNELTLHDGSYRLRTSLGNKHEVDMSEIGERVKKIVVEHLGVEPEKVVDSASFIDDLGADSLDTVELVMAFEEEFGCEIPDDAAETILTVGDATKFLEKNAKS
jgi:acyl carrier protein